MTTSFKTALPAKRRLRQLTLAVAATLPLAPLAVHADELSDLKAQIQALSKRLADIEAREAEDKAKAASAPAPAPASGGQFAVVAPALKTDISGYVLSDPVNAVQLYNNGNTSLHMYGIIEATISHANNQTASGGSATGFQTAWFSGNRLGFDMEHALGLGNDIGLPGLKVIAKLESEFELPTGNMDTANVIFNRDAWMGFYSPDLGKITLGRQNTLTRDFTNNWGDPYDVATETTLREGGYTNVNNYKQIIFYSGGPNSTRYNSAIEWRKKWDAHWLTGLAYKFGSAGPGGSGDVGNGGGAPGDFTNGSAQAASVAYNALDLGGVIINLNASYNHATTGPADLKNTAELVGGNANFGPFRFNTGFIHYSAQQGVDNSVGQRTDKAWTTSLSYRPNKTEFAIGYQSMMASHAGLNGGGKVVNAFGNMAGVTTTVNGAKDTVYGSIMYHEDRQTDFYVTADYFHVTGGYEVGDAQGSSQVYGAGNPYHGETELATGVRFKF